MARAGSSLNASTSQISTHSRNKLLLYLSICLFLIIMLVPPGLSQQDENFGWTEVENSIDSTLNDVVNFNITNTIAVGAGGVITSTEDEGLTWNQELQNEDNDLNAISMNNNTFYTVGDLGTIYRKILGEPWEIITPFTGVDLYSISHISPQKGSFENTIIYVGGGSGEVWKSTDGGTTWNFQDLQITNDILGIEFYNSSHGMLVGSEALLMGTSNGGTLWEARDVPVGITGALRDIIIVNYVRMYAVGDDGAFIKSSGSNIGWTWSQLNASTTEDLYGLTASSINKIWAVGTNGIVVNSVNGGTAFVSQKVQTDINTTNFFAIDVSDAENGWIVGEEGSSLVTTTGGVALRDIPTVKDLNDWGEYLDFALPILVEGFQNMLEILFLSIAIGFILGLIIAIIRTSSGGYINPYILMADLKNPRNDNLRVIWSYMLSVFHYLIKSLAVAFVDFVRNTPLLVQLFIVHFGFPEAGIFLTVPGRDRVFVSAFLGLGLNSAAYQSEIIRSGIQAIPVGQREAGRSIGLSYFQTMRYVILPQAIRLTIPPLGNEIANLALNTSLVSVIGYFELTRGAKIIIATTFLNFRTYAVLLLFYFVVTYSFTTLLKYLERKSKIPGLGV